MRKAALSGLAMGLGAILLFQSPLAEACGDKLLSIARALRLKHAYTAQYPAAILLYLGDLEKAETSRHERNRLVHLSVLYMSMRQAGHKLDVAQNPEELNQKLREQPFDFVMADYGDLEVVDASPALGTGVEVLPVLFKPEKEEFAAAQALFKLVLKTPATSIDHLEAIDEAMASRVGNAASGAGH